MQAVNRESGCRISEALPLTPKSINFSVKVIVFESLKKRKRGVFRGTVLA